MIPEHETAGPCYAVIFTAEMADDLDGYDETAARMRQLAALQPGFLGLDSTMEGKNEITVSYWRSLKNIADWKQNPEHRAAQEQGRKRWYRRFFVRVVKVERQYGSGG